jgi:hypothetical protein
MFAFLSQKSQLKQASERDENKTHLTVTLEELLLVTLQNSPALFTDLSCHVMVLLAPEKVHIRAVRCFKVSSFSWSIKVQKKNQLL